MNTNDTPFRILAVCLGNICRSPLAEGLLKRTAAERGLLWEVDSAGTGGYHVGELADPRSRAIAAQYGLDITDQRSRKFSREDFDRFDLILAMDRKNYADLRSLTTKEEHRQKVVLLLDYVSLKEETGPDVFDPYWDDSGFEGVYRLLERAASRVADRVVEQTSK